MCILHGATRVSDFHSPTSLCCVCKPSTSIKTSHTETTIDAKFPASWAPARPLLQQAWKGCWCYTWSTACATAASAQDRRTSFPPATRAVELSPLACGYFLLVQCFMKAKEARQRSVLRAGHVQGSWLAPSGYILSTGAYAAKQDANAMAMR